MDIESILASGFREFGVPSGLSCDRFFQRPERDENGDCYFLNIGYYDNRRYVGGHEGYQADVQFYMGDYYANLSVSVPRNKNIEEVVCWFKSMWQKMGAGYARRNSE
jgi:hypothetical protein